MGYVVCGLPGCGKSTLAASISARLRLLVFSVDPIESAILRSGIERSFETGLAAYLIIETLADEQLKLGHSVIIDAVSAIPKAKQMWRELAAKYQAHLAIIECVCSDASIHKKRVEARVRGIYGMHEVTWDDVQKRKSEYIAWDEARLTIDAINSPETNMRQALTYLKNK